MYVRTTCTECGAVIKAPDDFRGKRYRCPECRRVFTVPLTRDRSNREFLDEAEEAVADRSGPRRRREGNRPLAAFLLGLVLAGGGLLLLLLLGIAGVLLWWALRK